MLKCVFNLPFLFFRFLFSSVCVLARTCVSGFLVFFFVCALPQEFICVHFWLLSFRRTDGRLSEVEPSTSKLTPQLW